MEFLAPKPGETELSRNISFVINVEGTPYQAAASLFSDTLSVEELNEKLIKPEKSD